MTLTELLNKLKELEAGFGDVDVVIDNDNEYEILDIRFSAVHKKIFIVADD